MTLDADELTTRTLRGDTTAMARLLSLIETEAPQAPDILKKLYPARKKSFRVGITGPPGSGKSTLVDRLALEARQHHFKVGIVCVDPTSPFTGGAILGDRIRMSKAAADPEVFIRSMAARGSLGGIARATEAMVEVMEAAGKDLVFIETVGVGQSELDIFHAVDTVVVVLVPESGSGIQAMKAGLMEIAHLFVVNKADRPGAARLQEDLQDVLSFAPKKPWEIPVFLTQAYRGIGAKDVFESILNHQRFLENAAAGEHDTHRRLEKKIENLTREKIEKRFLQSPEAKQLLHHLIQKIAAGELNPYAAAEEMVRVGTLPRKSGTPPEVSPRIAAQSGDTSGSVPTQKREESRP